jgi:transcriptional regulator with XRE-family HTH domain
MELFNIPFIDDHYNVTLKDVAKKLGVSRSSIVEILKENGLEAINFPDFLLDYNHLEALSEKYVESVKSLQNRFSKKYFFYNLNEREQIQKFLLKFINTEQISENLFFDENIIKSKLDKKLIKEFFFNLIDEIRLEVSLGKLSIQIKDDYKKFRILIPKIKIKIKRSFSNNNSNIFFLTITGHYYIFTDEEEQIVEKKFTKDFSTIKHICRGALSNIHHLMFINNGKYKSTNRKYKKLQFI